MIKKGVLNMFEKVLEELEETLKEGWITLEQYNEYLEMIEEEMEKYGEK